MKNLFIALILLPTFFQVSISFSQDDLLDMLNDMEEERTEYTTASFKTVRIMNTHSIESSAKGVLTLIISHRFGQINGGAYEFFGLDQANMRLGFDYGINSRLSVGIGRSNIRKMYDSFLKFKLLRQSSGKRNFPFSASYVGAIQAQSLTSTTKAPPLYPFVLLYFPTSRETKTLSFKEITFSKIYFIGFVAEEAY